MFNKKKSWWEINNKYVYPARELIHYGRYEEAKKLLEKGAPLMQESLVGQFNCLEDWEQAIFSAPCDG